jgi:hypothetical protein
MAGWTMSGDERWRLAATLDLDPRTLTPEKVLARLAELQARVAREPSARSPPVTRRASCGSTRPPLCLPSGRARGRARPTWKGQIDLRGRTRNEDEEVAGRVAWADLAGKSRLVLPTGHVVDDLPVAQRSHDDEYAATVNLGYDGCALLDGYGLKRPIRPAVKGLRFRVRVCVERRVGRRSAGRSECAECHHESGE